MFLPRPLARLLTVAGVTTALITAGAGIASAHVEVSSPEATLIAPCSTVSAGIDSNSCPPNSTMNR